MVTYSFSQQVNNNWVVKRDWCCAKDGGNYIIPISTEYLGRDIAAVANDVNNRVTGSWMRLVISAITISTKMNLLGPPVIVKTDTTLSVSPAFTKVDSLYMFTLTLYHTRSAKI